MDVWHLNPLVAACALLLGALLPGVVALRDTAHLHSEDVVASKVGDYSGVNWKAFFDKSPAYIIAKAKAADDGCDNVIWHEESDHTTEYVQFPIGPNPGIKRARVDKTEGNQHLWESAGVPKADWEVMVSAMPEEVSYVEIASGLGSHGSFWEKMRIVSDPEAMKAKEAELLIAAKKSFEHFKDNRDKLAEIFKEPVPTDVAEVSLEKVRADVLDKEITSAGHPKAVEWRTAGVHRGQPITIPESATPYINTVQLVGDIVTSCIDWYTAKTSGWKVWCKEDDSANKHAPDGRFDTIAKEMCLGYQDIEVPEGYTE